jgi:hypothetical protein
MVRRPVASGAFSTTLPSGAPNGKTITYSDLGNNFGTNNGTISAPGGQTIAGLANIPLNVSGETATFQYYSAVNTWGYSLSVAPNSTTPSGTIAYFDLSSCPSGWAAADGTGSTVNVVGQFIRSLNTSGSGYDPDRTLASAQSDSVQPLGVGVASSLYVGSTTAYYGTATGGSPLIPQTAQALIAANFSITGTGSETRPQNVALLACQKS